MGVVRDSKYADITESPLPIAYLPLSQNHETGVTLYVRGTVPPASLVGGLRREVQALEPNLPIANVRTMEETIGARCTRRAWGRASLRVRRARAAARGRRRLRRPVVLDRPADARDGDPRGARRRCRKVFGLVVREGMSLVAIGTVVGLAAAAASATWLGSFLYTIGPRDPVAFATAPIVLAAVALLACLAPAYRAMRVSPVMALRQ